MRPAGRGELDLLYFSYPHFDAPKRTQSVECEPVPVCIVGAGPVGLVAALTLARFGVRSIVVDRKSTFNDGSRAICVARSSFHVLDAIGAVEPFLAKSLGWTKGITSYRGQPILEFEMPHGRDEKYLPMYNLQQQYIEQYLYDAAMASGLVDVRWQTSFHALEQTSGGVSVVLDDPSGRYSIAAQWLLAADGARSAIRQHLGLRLAGENHEGRYVIADVKMNHDFPTVRRALFDPPSNPGATVLIHKQPDDIWRIDYQVPSSDDPDAAVAEPVVRAKVAAILKDIGHLGPWDLEWWSIYTANTLALDSYQHGRVVFVGDSAHIVPIFGVRGLNNGIADGQNIGWKLAKVIKGEAGAALIDSYTPERRGATLDVFANATKSTRFMTPPTAGWMLTRDAALSLALKHDFARPLANPRQMAPYTYTGSPLTQSEDAAVKVSMGGPQPGAFAPNVRLPNGQYLLDGIGTGFTGIYFATEGAAFDATSINAIDPGFRLVALRTSNSDETFRAVHARLCRTGRQLLSYPARFLCGSALGQSRRRVHRALSSRHSRDCDIRIKP